MELLAKELAQNEEIGLDEATLLRIFESKTEKLILAATANKFTFDHDAGNNTRSMKNH